MNSKFKNYFSSLLLLICFGCTNQTKADLIKADSNDLDSNFEAHLKYFIDESADVN